MRTQFNEMTDFQWQVMQENLPAQLFDRKRQHDLRVIINAILWILNVGGQWRNLDSKYPPWQSVYYYYRKFKLQHIDDYLNLNLVIMERQEYWEKSDIPTLACIDSQSVKIVPFISQDTGYDGFKKVKGRKRHILTDSLGLVMAVVVTAANVADVNIAKSLMNKCKTHLAEIKKVAVDAAYKGEFEQWVQSEFNAEVEIASRPPSAQGFVPVKCRWVIERTFGYNTFYRRLSRDYEKTAKSSESWITWANIQTIISRLEYS
jgi:putative transposase